MSATCQHCGEKYKRRHPAQRFCSHKGAGNCKDAFWNSHPDRIDRTVAYLESQGIDVDKDRIGMTQAERDHEAAMEGSEMGWDAHKGYF
jgi:hypothetical protein